MEFLLELLLTAVVALLFSFLVAKIVSVSMAGESDRSSDQIEKTEIGVGDGSATVEELCFGLKVDAPVVQSERKLRVVVDENVEHVDRFGNGADRVVDKVEEAARDVELVVLTTEANEFLAALSPGNVIAKEMIVRDEDEGREETSGEVGDERQELIESTAEAESTASVVQENMIAEEIINRGHEEELSSAEGVSSCVERGEVVVTESEEVRVEESNSGEKSEDKMEFSIEEQVELSIEEDDDDDDWEGIEKSELEITFSAASNLLEQSGKGEEITAEAKMELYGLHKIATEGSCREAQPMAIMLSARAKWNAWQRLGNMSQEEAMEQYLALVSKEIPGLLNTVGKMPETETSVDLGSLEDPTTLDTIGVATSKNVSGEDESSV
ncbi:PREDICTED: acyl-CoA-binding domain-containing protein 3 isoform X2 [Brassica oleracea var. oleracea]|uniref:acyl-CoA-binding domain-containing protein 3 isoform X2 n=1 Tax=Brassica oleracea var. oleracea TaxID=109376 RepID=UPI0006A6F1BB|nr:PREDICTED: acyl-CoA-binding domain-containing protein 3 isoform X2 [Brassica oleracea var. oleracea]